MMEDYKPLYACSLNELNAAKRLIRRNAGFYGLERYRDR